MPATDFRQTKCLGSGGRQSMLFASGRPRRPSPTAGGKETWRPLAGSPTDALCRCNHVGTTGHRSNNLDAAPLCPLFFPLTGEQAPAPSLGEIPLIFKKPCLVTSSSLAEGQA